MSAERLKSSAKLNKEVSAFIKQIDIASSLHPQRKSITYDEFLSDRMLIIAAIRAGIPYSLFKAIQAETPFTEHDWADFLDISSKSLQRYRVSENHQFKPIHTEKIIELAEVTRVGMDVFSDMSSFKQWLHTPNYALGNLKPIELLKDSYGKEMVITELIHLNHGILV